MKKYLLNVLTLLLFANLLDGQILINEYSAANLSTITDDFEKHEDWIEIYNNSDVVNDVSGFAISDDLKEPLKWKIPKGTIITARGFLIIYCDNRDTLSKLKNEKYFHSNFNLTQTKKNAQTLVLSDINGARLDQVEVKKTRAGQSRGRLTDAAAQWVIFDHPTPSANNDGLYFTSNAEKPEFSVKAGFYNTAFMLNISSKISGAAIYYTLDGTDPDKKSKKYTSPITIDKTTVVKAIVIANDFMVQPSLIEFATYFLFKKHNLKVISISGGTELDSLAGGNKNIEPFGTFEFFDENGQRKATTYGEFNSHGQDSWVNDQRSLDFISRDECGYNKSINEKLFDLTDRNEFQRIILRAAGDDNYPDGSMTKGGGAHVRDAFLQNLVKKGGLSLDVRTAEKTVLYINGKYWGIYDIRERPDDHDFTNYYYKQGKYDLEMLQTWSNTWAEYGGDTAIAKWTNFAKFASTADLSQTEKYDKVIEQLDIKSLSDYIITNSVSVCSDWINYNTGWWRGMNPAGSHKKWGFQLWDNDATFGYYKNFTGIKDTAAVIANPCDIELLSDSVSISFEAYITPDTIIFGGVTYFPGDTLHPAGTYKTLVDLNKHIAIFNSLMKNPIFKQYYISRYHDLMKTVFSKENMLMNLDEVVNSITQEMPEHIKRWGGSISEWQANVNKLRNYIERRGEYLEASLQDCYQLEGPYKVTFDATGAPNPTLEINSLSIEKFPYTSDFFGDLGISITAKPNDAEYQFNNWKNDDKVKIQTIKPGVALFYPESSAAITAEFIKNTLSTNQKTETTDNCEIEVFPTVFDQSIFIKSPPESGGPIIVRLFDLNGRQRGVFNAVLDDDKLESKITTISTAHLHLSPGMYLIDIQTTHKHCLKKIIKS
ncbi:MAG: CotH kinase family protein [Saprospiraceae bacterium]